MNPPESDPRLVAKSRSTSNNRVKHQPGKSSTVSNFAKLEDPANTTKQLKHHLASTFRPAPGTTMMLELLRSTAVLFFLTVTFCGFGWLLNPARALMSFCHKYLVLYVETVDRAINYAFINMLLFTVALFTPFYETFGILTLTAYLFLRSTYYHDNPEAILFRPLRWADHDQSWVYSRAGPTCLKKFSASILQYCRYLTLCLAGYVAFFCALPPVTVTLATALEPRASPAWLTPTRPTNPVVYIGLAERA
ncbi:hypothetical protein P171DRAFT_492008 [Karstenula rhodostoma CBS 690.94]|uniref:Uncharacterized protein n=1 Tax=Karstenula rhodostoma CBS 690.94 TaxID=1392251 RepID=A0A9P4U621_9PLEO|nr:hypothetical protein P171DRAFT_492008 [Karstenula rhodostoma CBS 690.94]